MVFERLGSLPVLPKGSRFRKPLLHADQSHVVLVHGDLLSKLTPHVGVSAQIDGCIWVPGKNW